MFIIIDNYLLIFIVDSDVHTQLNCSVGALRAPYVHYFFYEVSTYRLSTISLYE
jgi:hypothetical protein